MAREGETIEATNPPIWIDVGRARIVVQHDFDAQLLREVVRALDGSR